MLPRIQPIAPVRAKAPFDDPEWLFDLKYDGFRALAYLEQGRCRLISRTGNLMSRFAHLSDQIAAVLDVGDAILDGEVIAVDETGRPQFYDLLRNTRAPVYVAFDLLWLDGADLRPLPLTERRQRLQGILPKGSALISEALSVTGMGYKLFELMCAHDLEGIVAKRLKDPYGPRVRWLKIKNPGYSQNEGRHELFDSARRARAPSPSPPRRPMTAAITARGPLKVVAVLNAVELLNIELPDGKLRFTLTIRLPDGAVTADLAAKSVRRAIAMVREHGPEAVAAIVQGRLSGNQIAEAGLSVQPKGSKPEKAEAAA